MNTAPINYAYLSGALIAELKGIAYDYKIKDLTDEQREMINKRALELIERAHINAREFSRQDAKL